MVTMLRAEDIQQADEQETYEHAPAQALSAEGAGAGTAGSGAMPDGLLSAMPSASDIAAIREKMIQDALRMFRDGLNYHELTLPSGAFGVRTIIDLKSKLDDIERFFMKEVLPAMRAAAV